MILYIGADHRGFSEKQQLVTFLKGKGYEVHDMGAVSKDPLDDYVDFAASVGREVLKNPDSRGIVLCGSGVGVDVSANKIKGIRCGLGFTPEQIKAARADDDINVLALASDYSDREQIQDIVEVFLTTPFQGEERHMRRIEKIKKLEKYDE